MSVKSAFVQLAWTFFIALVGAFASFAVVWPSYALKVLESDGSPLGFKLLKYQSNLVGSIPMLGSLIATLAAGTVVCGIGRKKSLIVAALVFGMSWSLILTARSFTQILIGRCLVGISGGLGGVINYVYVCEITQIKLRGIATPFLSFIYTVGILTSYILGWFCSYDVICYISMATMVVYLLVIVLFMRDSPAYLLSIGQDKKALASLKFYRGETVTTDAILEEFSVLKDLCSKGDNNKESIKATDDEKQQLQNETEATENSQENTNPWKLIFTVDYNRRTAIITMSTMALSSCLGMVAIQTYAGQFFTMAAPSLSSDLCSVILAIGFVISCFITTIVTNMFSRRFLVMSSNIVVTICLVTLGTLLRWSWGPAWLFLVILAVYVIFYHLGPINMAFLQMSECFGPQEHLRLENVHRWYHFLSAFLLFPLLGHWLTLGESNSVIVYHADPVRIDTIFEHGGFRVNSTGTALVFSTMFVSNFTALFLFVPAMDLLGIDVTFFVFAAFGVITTIYSFLFIKETRNVPVGEIQKMFARGFLHKRSDTL